MTYPYSRPLYKRIAVRLDLFIKRLENYRYFRGKGKGIRESWERAGRTLN